MRTINFLIGSLCLLLSQTHAFAGGNDPELHVAVLDASTAVAKIKFASTENATYGVTINYYPSSDCTGTAVTENIQKTFTPVSTSTVYSLSGSGLYNYANAWAIAHSGAFNAFAGSSFHGIQSINYADYAPPGLRSQTEHTSPICITVAWNSATALIYLAGTVETVTLTVPITG